MQTSEMVLPVTVIIANIVLLGNAIARANFLFFVSVQVVFLFFVFPYLWFLDLYLFWIQRHIKSASIIIGAL